MVRLLARFGVIRYSRFRPNLRLGASMTPDLIRALAISGGILIAVVILTVLVSVVTVRRGEVEMAERATEHRGRSARH
jgi:hypothetical protein